MAEVCWQGTAEVSLTVTATISLQGHAPIDSLESEPTEAQLAAARRDALIKAQEQLRTGQIRNIGPLLEYGIEDMTFENGYIKRGTIKEV